MEDAANVTPAEFNSLRADYFQKLAIEHDLTIDEIQKIHDETYLKLTRLEAKGAMLMNIAFPAALKHYKENQA